MADDELAAIAGKAARQAKQAAWLCILALAVAIAVLAIDNSIKKALLDEAQKARALLDEAQELVAAKIAVVVGSMAAADKEAGDDGTAATGEGGAPASGGVDGANGVVDASGASAAATGNARTGGRATGGRPRSKTAGPRRDG